MATSEDALPPLRFHYRCSNGHWVGSNRSDLEDEPCTAWFGTPASTVDRILCGGTIGIAYVEWDQVEPLLPCTDGRP